MDYLSLSNNSKQIHLSKNTYCTYLDPVNDHQYDIILPTVAKINQRTIAEARRNRADRLKREGIVVDPKKIPNTDLVFRITCWDHIPMAAKKIPKSQQKKKKIEVEYRNPIGIPGGKFTKNDMCLAIIDNTNVSNDKWFTYLKSIRNEIMGAKNIPKPHEDINDAVFLYHILQKQFSKIDI